MTASHQIQNLLQGKSFILVLSRGAWEYLERCVSVCETSNPSLCVCMCQLVYWHEREQLNAYPNRSAPAGGRGYSLCFSACDILSEVMLCLELVIA